MTSIDFKKVKFMEPKQIVENSFDKSESLIYKSNLNYENNNCMFIKTPKLEVSYIDEKQINL